MSRAIQIRRGTADEHSNFTGLLAEVTFDTTNKTLRVHDGQTPGGFSLARADAETNLDGADYVTAWQTPTAENNYTWYRKYKSGWVEQGGKVSNKQNECITLPHAMQDSSYSIMLSFSTESANVPQYGSFAFKQQQNTGFIICNYGSIDGYWNVCGVVSN